jgi:L-lactate dehydrogenase complex protein LldE
VPRVQLFPTCLVEGFFPEAAQATRAVLERAGCEVEVPPYSTCCGQPAFNTGLTDEARVLAGKLVTELAGSADPVVVPSGSCADMLTHHLPGLLADSPDLAEAAVAVAGRIRELTAFLVDDLGQVELGASFAHRVAYHPSCHGLRNLGLGPQALALLARVDGLQLVEFERAEECCGFGGLFSVELPEVSAAIMASKLDHIEHSAPEVVVGGDVACLLHLGGGLHRRGSTIAVLHISQILAGDR